MANIAKTRFGQLVIGPPGSGKTTYVIGQEGGHRQSWSSQKEHYLHCWHGHLRPRPGRGGHGPDEARSQWRFDVRHPVCQGKPGLDSWQNWPVKLLDIWLSGQVELYTADDNINSIIDHLTSQDLRLTCVNLVDSHHCSDAGKFVSVLTSLTPMLQIALPDVNLLIKVKEDFIHFH